jgi:hypothetical protein
VEVQQGTYQPRSSTRKTWPWTFHCGRFEDDGERYGGESTCAMPLRQADDERLR